MGGGCQALMSNDGKQIKINIGESLVHLFQPIGNDSELIASLSDFTVAHETRHEDKIFAFGTTAIIVGTPDKIQLALTDTDSALLEEGNYYGTITLTNTVE